MSYYDHGAVQNYIASLLRHYGFNSRKEVWISREDRVDVAGWCVNKNICKGLSIAVEVSKTSDLAKDLDKLRRAKFDLKFIIMLKPYDFLSQEKD